MSFNFSSPVPWGLLFSLRMGVVNYLGVHGMILSITGHASRLSPSLASVIMSRCLLTHHTGNLALCMATLLIMTLIYLYNFQNKLHLLVQVLQSYMKQFKLAHFKSQKVITEKGVLQLRFLFLAVQFISVNKSWCLSRGCYAQALKAAIVSPRSPEVEQKGTQPKWR